MKTLTPSTPAEMAEALRACAAAKRAVQAGGCFSKNRQGGPLPHPADRISTRGLSQVLKYEPNDLTISVEAGMRWAELIRLLDGHGQMLPLDPPFFRQATVGGVIASNLCGPRRRQYGSVRDVVIGMTCATTEGKLVPSGGMVVKNVAGLDLAKLMIGSLGTLAVITSVNFRVSPKPRASRTFALAGGDLPGLFAQRSEILAGALQPAAIDVLNAEASVRVGLERTPHLLLEALGTERVLKRFAEGLPGFAVMDHAIWTRVRDWIPAWLAEQPEGCLLRVSTKLTEMAGVMAAMPGPAVARAGNGVIYSAFPSVAQASACQFPSSVIEFAPEDAKRSLDLWPQPGDAYPLMRQLKTLYDPDGILNPGRYYGRF